MSINFFDAKCQGVSNNEKFWLNDDPHPSQNPAYIVECEDKKWIAEVVNAGKYLVTFTAVDNCIETKRIDGKMDKRCDGFLSYDSTIAFVELKKRSGLGKEWVKDGEKQLRATIGHFEAGEDAEKFTTKKAYIANSERPKFKESQTRRMEQFLNDTGYTLRIENRIRL